MQSGLIRDMYFFVIWLHNPDTPTFIRSYTCRFCVCGMCRISCVFTVWPGFSRRRRRTHTRSCSSTRSDGSSCFPSTVCSSCWRPWRRRSRPAATKPLWPVCFSLFTQVCRWNGSLRLYVFDFHSPSVKMMYSRCMRWSDFVELTVNTFGPLSGLQTTNNTYIVATANYSFLFVSPVMLFPGCISYILGCLDRLLTS